MAFCFAILDVPIAKEMVTMEDNASGIAATAKATANMSESIIAANNSFPGSS